MSNIWFTSDTHYFHKNIAGPKVSTWKKGYRDFEDEGEMSRHIVKIFNETVAENDILYHLGDWSFGGVQNIWNFRKQLKCKNIHLILGNHDHHIKENKFLNYLVKDLETGVVTESLEKLELGIFPRSNYVFTKHLFNSVNDVLITKHDNYTFFLSHYSHQVWFGSNKGVIHLFGHSHDSIKGIGKSMDVGIDVTKRILGEYRPFSLEEIISFMNNKEIEFLDHHNAKTDIK